MRRHALLVSSLALGLTLTSQGGFAGPPPPPRGALIVIGGGSVPAEARAKALALCGAREPVVAILPQASALPDRGQGSVAPWKEAGAARVLLVDPLDDTSHKVIESADVIWMPGGAQDRLVEALRSAGLIDVIRARYTAGAVVAGTSAGAAVMSARMLTGKADLRSVSAQSTELAHGLGLWRGVIVDQHFVRRQRNNRLLSAVLDHPELVGYGIDEGTAVVVTRKGIEVVGKGTVLVYDARQAKVEKASPGDRHGATGVRMHVLRAGLKLPRR
jgi:cyanophycinase